jgi:hypothetical protein
MSTGIGAAATRSASSEHNNPTRRIEMSNVMAVHSVEDMGTWLGNENRPGLFKKFCSGYRLYRMPDQSKVAIVWENVDMPKLQQVFASREADAAKKADTVVEPIDIFVELEGKH